MYVEQNYFIQDGRLGLTRQPDHIVVIIAHLFGKEAQTLLEGPAALLWIEELFVVKQSRNDAIMLKEHVNQRFVFENEDLVQELRVKVVHVHEH